MNNELVSREFNSQIKKIKSDKYSGSVRVLNETISALYNFLVKEKDLPEKELIYLMQTSIKSVVEIHNQFSALDHFYHEAVLSMEDFIEKRNKLGKDDPEKPSLQNYLLGITADYINKWKNVNRKIAALVYSAYDFKDKTVLIHSNSNTILALFEYLKEQDVYPDIIQTESRPKFEGRILAEQLSEMGFKVNMIVDAAMVKYLTKVNIALIGCDCIFPDFFINKIGSMPLALGCQRMKVPLYVLADSRKLSKQTQIKSEKRKTAGEVWHTSIQGIHIENYYFETIPNELISKLITESFAIEGNQISNQFDNLIS
jgi:translation initiation factor 2B subunit (eIF-2B alpha/beta/delta family)